MEHTDKQTTDNIDQRDDNAGDRITANKLAGTIHGSVKIGFRFDLAPAFARFLLGDEAGIEICINRHLLTGHGIQGEACRDFRHPTRTFGDHDKVNHNKNRKYDETNNVVVSDNEIPEGMDHLPHCLWSFMTF